jgi:formamidopyrimidine-DNA glycosylase
MPELPEAETIVRELRGKVTSRVVTNVKVIWPDILTPPLTPRRLSRSLKHRRIASVDRRAKNIIVRFDHEAVLMINLGMTGRVIASSAKPANELTHVAVRLDLDNGSAMLYDDARRFGRWELFTPATWLEREQRFGPEPLGEAFTATRLHAATRRSISPIRNWLLDQTNVAGVGNIYANEALFAAGIDPSKPARLLTHDDHVKLHAEIQRILTAAIDSNGTTFRDYRTGTGEAGNFQLELQVYGREGEPCRVCGTRLAGTHTIDGRTTVFCHRCQW